MKRLIASILAAVVWGAIAATGQSGLRGEELSGELAHSPLMNGGELQKSRDQLAQIFAFTIEADQLKIDRAAWESTAQEIAKNDAALATAAANNPPPDRFQDPAWTRFRAEREARDKERREKQIARMGGPPPVLHVLFRQIEEQARKASQGFSGGGDLPGAVMHNGWKEWNSGFEGDTLAGELRTNNEGEELFLRELKSPNRTLEFRSVNDSGFRIQLADPDGDLILLRQDAIGRFFVVAMANGKTLSGQADSFVAFFKEHRGQSRTDILSGLARIGICPIVPPDAPEVRKAVWALLLRTPEKVAEGKQLLTDLDSVDSATSEKAAKLLGSLYHLFYDLIQRKIQDPATFSESRTQLQGIVAEQSDSHMVAETIAALDLFNDPQYVVSFLDDADPREGLKLIRRLESITGQNFGADLEAWKKWAQAKK